MKRGMNASSKILISVVIAGFSVLLVIFFISQMGATRPDDVSAVIDDVPPRFKLIEQTGELAGNPNREVSRKILSYNAQFPNEQKVGIKYSVKGSVTYLLVDFNRDFIEERTTNSRGTKVRTVWHRNVTERLRYAEESGNFSPPGFPQPEKTNLYH
jgi:hypothetical protein